MKYIILSQDTASTQDFYYYIENGREINSLMGGYEYMDGPGWYYLRHYGVYTQSGKYRFTGEQRTLTIRIYINGVRTPVKQVFDVVENINKETKYFANAQNNWNLYPYTATTTENSVVDNTYSYTMRYYNIRKFTTGLTIDEPVPGVRYLSTQDIIQYNNPFPKIVFSTEAFPGQSAVKLDEKPFSEYGITTDTINMYNTYLKNGTYPLSMMNIELNGNKVDEAHMRISGDLVFLADNLFVILNQETSKVEFWISAEPGPS